MANTNKKMSEPYGIQHLRIKNDHTDFMIQPKDLVRIACNKRACQCIEKNCKSQQIIMDFAIEMPNP